MLYIPWPCSAVNLWKREIFLDQILFCDLYGIGQSVLHRKGARRRMVLIIIASTRLRRTHKFNMKSKKDASLCSQWEHWINTCGIKIQFQCNVVLQCPLKLNLDRKLRLIMTNKNIYKKTIARNSICLEWFRWLRAALEHCRCERVESRGRAGAFSFTRSLRRGAACLLVVFNQS